MNNMFRRPPRRITNGCSGSGGPLGRTPRSAPLSVNRIECTAAVIRPIRSPPASRSCRTTARAERRGAIACSSPCPAWSAPRERDKSIARRLYDGHPVDCRQSMHRHPNDGRGKKIRRGASRRRAEVVRSAQSYTSSRTQRRRAATVPNAPAKRMTRRACVRTSICPRP
jgi:hypothetical protein